MIKFNFSKHQKYFNIINIYENNKLIKIRLIEVAEKYRRLSKGKELIKAIQRHAKIHNKEIRLEACPYAMNEVKLQKLYENLGFIFNKKKGIWNANKNK